MIKFYPNYFKKEDHRGEMIGLINEGNWKEINFFSTNPNQLRGHHFHKETDELFIILKGKVKIKLTKVSDKGKLIDETASLEAMEGDVFIIPKMIHHVFEIVKKTEWINALSLKMSDKDPDIYLIK